MYKKYEQRELIREWEKLYAKNREDVIRIEEEWKRVEEYNEEVWQECLNKMGVALREIEGVLAKERVEYRKTGGRGGYYAWYENNILRPVKRRYLRDQPRKPEAFTGVQVIKGIEVLNNVSPVGLVKLYDIIHRDYRIKKQREDRDNKLLQESVRYADRNNIDIEGLGSDDIIRIVNDFAEEEYRIKHLPIGTEVYLKNECLECSTYTVGDRRCECGNRRIGMEVEGNIVEGFISYPEPF